MRELRQVLAADMGDMMIRIRELEMQTDNLQVVVAQKDEEIRILRESAEARPATADLGEQNGA